MCVCFIPFCYYFRWCKVCQVETISLILTPVKALYSVTQTIESAVFRLCTFLNFCRTHFPDYFKVATSVFVLLRGACRHVYTQVRSTRAEKSHYKIGVLSDIFAYSFVIKSVVLTMESTTSKIVPTRKQTYLVNEHINIVLGLFLFIVYLRIC